MARKVTTRYFSDITGDEIQDGDVVVVTFTLPDAAPNRRAELSTADLASLFTQDVDGEYVPLDLLDIAAEVKRGRPEGS